MAVAGAAGELVEGRLLTSQLRRPGAYYPEWRLDRLLKRKAEEGVLIYIQVYKEACGSEPATLTVQVTASMSLGSKHTKVCFGCGR